MFHRNLDKDMISLQCELSNVFSDMIKILCEFLNVYSGEMIA